MPKRETKVTGEARGDVGRPAVLDARQKQLVADNLALVGLHLAKQVGPIRRPRSDRERDDLFQEGCLGLIRAAKAYDPASGIPFAAFALLRIRNAVNLALRRQSGITAASTQQRGATSVKGGDEPADAEPIEPRIRQLSPSDMRSLAARPEPKDMGPEGETIGDRLRRKYRRALGAAVATTSRHGGGRDDRLRLVRMLVQERFLVPCGHEKCALRRIARDTNSSYSRVAGCERQLAEFIRRWLEADPEFQTLRELARRSPAGTGHVIDAATERELAASSCDAFVARFDLADSKDRTRLLGRLLSLPGARPPDELLRRHVASLPHTSRQRLWALDGSCVARPAPRRRSA